MKKLVVILISVILAAGFIFLSYSGFRYRLGIPVPIEKLQRPTLLVPFIDKEIDLASGIDSEFWDTLPSQEIKLQYQVMILPWPKKVVPLEKVKAFHNKNDVYFYLTWPDETEDRVVEVDKFPDACAIMFPLEEEVPASTIMMGFMVKANLWQWKANHDKRFWEKESTPNLEEVLLSAVSDIIAKGAGTVTKKERQDVSGRGIWNGGNWQVVMRRSLTITDSEVDAVIDTGKRLCAFAVWNGEKGDRGGRKSVSDWVELDIQ